MSLRYPGSRWDPLSTKQTEPPMTSHDVACVHTMVGTLAGTSAMFHENGYGGTESHWGMGGEGEMDQWQDGMFEADANFNGNPYVLSLETADKGPQFTPWTGSDVPAWTKKQVNAIVNWLIWVTSREAHAGCPATWNCHRFGIPRSLIPDTKPGRRGIAYHRQGIDGNFPDGRVEGGVLWSASKGKVCPGDRRIAQLKNEIIPRVQAATGSAPPTPEEDDVPYEITDGKRVRLVFGGSVIGYPSNSSRTEIRASYAKAGMALKVVTVSAWWMDRLSSGAAAPVNMVKGVADTVNNNDRWVLLAAAGTQAAAGGDLEGQLDAILEAAELDEVPETPAPPVIEDGATPPGDG